MPASPAMRDEAVDVLRAISIIGVGLINILAFAYPADLSDGFVSRNFDNPIDRAVVAILVGFVLGKFIVIFAALFGWSAHAQLQAGATGRQAFIRRLIGLFLLGAVHFIFIFSGDILLTYSIAGVALVRSAAWPSARLRRSIITWLILSYAIFAALVLGSMLVGGPQADNSSLAIVYQSAGFAEIFAARWVSSSLYAVISMPLAFLWIVPIARLGFLTGRVQEECGAEYVMAIVSLWARRLFWPAVAVNLLAAIGVTTAQTDEVRFCFQMLAANVGGPLLAITYVAILLRFVTLRKSGAAMKTLAAAGRSSLSIYLMQSVVSSFIFFGYGLGWHGGVGPAAVVSLSLLSTLILVFLMLRWSRFFGRGPFERIARLEFLSLLNRS